MKPKQFLRPVMLAGTGSDVGKSVLATALCRIFRQDGFTPAPFKAQNMALNSAVTREGGEMGRAQAVQAEAAGVEPHTDMNPVLLKPSSDSTSQVIVGGRAVGNRNAWEYFRGEGRELLRAEAHAAFDRVASRFNPVVLEGAGSITELNLREGDIVNMSMARYADAAVVLVADIDRGGVFASLYGSVVLQTPEDRARIRGIIVNKFRGDMRLFDDGRRMIEELCGVPVLGVVPYFTGIAIEAEDSVVLAGKRFRAEVGSGRVNIAVVALGRISNFTDFDTLERDGRVHLYYTAEPEELLRANIIVVPGSKSTLDDLDRLWRSGAAQAIVQAWQGGATVLGICGGYQMLGREVRDPEGVEGGLSEVAGLGLLPVSTVMSGDKVVRQRRFRLSGSGGGLECSGYEIHNGRTEVGGGEALAVLDDGVPEGCRVQGASGVSGSAMGTYLHGILDNAPFIEMLLAPFSG
ncbi:MAG: cobyric acid synthase, partial [Alistipes sp.]|nr:cobyric acid synthase [Alistipes sp.]